MSTKEQSGREAFEALALPILGDNPTWRGSGDCELAWQAWRAALSTKPAEPVGASQPEPVRHPSITLTGQQLMAALYWAVPDDDRDHLEAEVTISWSDGIESEDEDQAREPGFVLWWSDYPEEGCVPLDEHPPGIPDLKRAICVALAAPPSPEPVGAEPATIWRCFHCDEAFTERAKAQEHFGPSEYEKPICQMDAGYIRWLLEQHRRNADDDSEALRTVGRLVNEHEALRRRAEELGYERGLADARKHPEEIGLVRAPQAPAPAVPSAEAKLREALELACEELAGFMNLPIENDAEWIARETADIALMDRLRAALGKPGWLESNGIQLAASTKEQP